MSRSWKPSQRLLLAAAVVFVSIAIITFIMALIFDSLFTSMMLKQLTILPDSLVYKSWQKPSVPVFFSFTVFNLTNKADVLSGSKPIFTEIGPFVYREARDRIEVIFSNETPPETVSFKQRVLHYFIPEHSVADPKTVQIVVPNLVHAALVAQGSYFASFADPFITLSVNDIIWGYTPMFSPQTVGLFHEKNGTSAEPLTIKTGVSDITSIGQIVSVGNKRKMDVWDSEEANKIIGTDGSVAAPGLSIGSKFHIFVPGLCRTVTTYAVGTANALNREEIELLSFSGVPPESESDAARAWNRLFCKSNVCPPEGLIAVDPCLKARGSSVPIFLSPPHFMDVDPAVSGAVDGVSQPDKLKHSTWMRIEPNTGFVLEASQRMQFNLYINKDYGHFRNLGSPYYHPMVWISEEAAADKGSLDTLYSKLLWPKKVIPIILSVICVVSSALAITFIVLLSIGRRLYSRRKLKLSPSSLTDGSTDCYYNVADGDLKSVSTKEDHFNNGPSVLLSSGLHSQVHEAKPLLNSTTNGDSLMA